MRGFPVSTHTRGPGRSCASPSNPQPAPRRSHSFPMGAASQWLLPVANTPLQEVSAGPPAGFTLTEARGDTLMTLTKRHGGETVTIDVMVNDQVRGYEGVMKGPHEGV